MPSEIGLVRRTVDGAIKGKTTEYDKVIALLDFPFDDQRLHLSPSKARNTPIVRRRG